MEQIDLQLRQRLLLDIAKEVCRIGKNHQIPIFMVGGTMLGAIRHKGFIPWDDDMDFGVTYDHYFELIDILKKELPPRFKCLYYEDDSPVHSFFFKVEDSHTVIDDPWVNLPIEKKLGLSIDIFPIVSCTKTGGEEAAKKVRRLINKERARMISQNASLPKKFAKHVVGFFSFGNYLKERRQIKKIIDEIPSGDCFCNIVSPQFWKIIWPKDTFNDLDEYAFEDTKFLGPKDFDAYLTRCYNNYMQLPPEEKRRAHALGVYFRNDISK